MAGRATQTSYAGHPSVAAKTDNALTSKSPHGVRPQVTPSDFRVLRDCHAVFDYAAAN